MALAVRAGSHFSLYFTHWDRWCGTQHPTYRHGDMLRPLPPVQLSATPADEQCDISAQLQR